MTCTQEQCKVKGILDRIRNQLEEAITNNFSNLLISDVIRLSQNLDKTVTHCVKCRTAKNIIDILDINHIAGRHSMFFYYGKEHLLVCLAQYIKRGLENNEFCGVFIQPDWYESLLEYFDLNTLPKKNIQYYPVNEMLENFITGGNSVLNAQAADLTRWAKEAGYSGIRMIGQCSYGIELSNKSKFLRFEDAITDAFRGTAVGALCVYDFNDFINSAAYIDDEILNDSFRTHTNIHFLSNRDAV